jgi:hypothetical protein
MRMKVSTSVFEQIKADMQTEYNSHGSELKIALRSSTFGQASNYLWQRICDDRLHDDSHPRFTQESPDKRLFAYEPAKSSTEILYPCDTNDVTLRTALERAWKEVMFKND